MAMGMGQAKKFGRYAGFRQGECMVSDIIFDLESVSVTI